MAQILKGLFFTTSAHTGFSQDVLYFVRQDANGNDGYLQFNGKKYGLPSSAISGLTEKIEELSGATVNLKEYVGTLPTGITENNVVEYFTNLISELSGNTSTTIQELSGVVKSFSGATVDEIGRLDRRIDDLSGVTKNFSAATVEEFGKVRTEMKVTLEEDTTTDSASTVGADSVKKYTLKQGGESIGTIEVPADIFVDKGTLITVNDEGLITYTQDEALYPLNEQIAELTGKAGTYIAIKFKNDEQSVIYINVTKLIDIYKVSGNSANYLTIEDYNIATKIVNIEDAKEGTTGLLDGWNVKQYIDNQGTNIADKLEELSGVTADFSASTVAEIQRIDDNIEEVSGNTVREVVVNGSKSTFANNTATVEVFASAVTLGKTVSGNSSTTIITDVLENIYGELSRIDKAAYGGIQSSDNAITVTEKSGDNPVQSISLKTETANDNTIADGHLEIKRNDNGELYAQMYYLGDDTVVINRN